MCFYNGIPFTMCAVIVQSIRSDTFCMSDAVMQLVAGTFCYENVVIYIANGVPFQCYVIQTDAMVYIGQRTYYNSFSWYNSMPEEIL